MHEIEIKISEICDIDEYEIQATALLLSTKLRLKKTDQTDIKVNLFDG